MKHSCLKHFWSLRTCSINSADIRIFDNRMTGSRTAGVRRVRGHYFTIFQRFRRTEFCMNFFQVPTRKKSSHFKDVEQPPLLQPSTRKIRINAIAMFDRLFLLRIFYSHSPKTDMLIFSDTSRLTLMFISSSRETTTLTDCLKADRMKPICSQKLNSRSNRQRQR